MKKSIKPLIFTIILFVFVAFTQIIRAQPAAPPPPPGELGSNTNHAPSNGAPLDGGLYVTLALVAGFGAWKWITSHKKIEN